MRKATFNKYLTVCIIAICTLMLTAGCASTKSKKNYPPIMQFYLESTIPDPERNLKVRISEEPPVDITIDRSRLMDQSNIRNIGIVERTGTFALMIAFDYRGTRILEQISTANRGQRCAIYCEFTFNKTNVSRWLGAPVITHRITDGILEFTPRMSREEAEVLVKQMQPVIKQNLKNQ